MKHASSIQGGLSRDCGPCCAISTGGFIVCFSGVEPKPPMSQFVNFFHNFSSNLYYWSVLVLQKINL